MRRTLTSLTAFLLALGGWIAAAQPVSGSSPSPPLGLHPVATSTLATGAQVTKLVAPGQQAYVGFVPHTASAHLKVISAPRTDKLGTEQLARVSDMCPDPQTVCANADYWGGGPDIASHPEPWGHPLGGVVSNCQMLQSPTDPSWEQVFIDRKGTISSGPAAWSGALTLYGQPSLSLAGVNTTRPADGLTLYTPAYAATTHTDQFGTKVAVPGSNPSQYQLPPVSELTLRLISPGQRQCVGDYIWLRAESLSSGGNSRIPADGMVLAGAGAASDRIRELWGQISGAPANVLTLKLQMGPPELMESFGANPLILHNGQYTGRFSPDCHAACANPQTLFGWNAAGDFCIVVIDGRQSAYHGMTLEQGAQLLLSQSCTEGVGADSGGSSTMTEGGSVLNSPSDVQVRRGGTVTTVRVAAPGDQVETHVVRAVANGVAVAPGPPLVLPPPAVVFVLPRPAARAAPPPAIPMPTAVATLAPESRLVRHKVPVATTFAAQHPAKASALRWLLPAVSAILAAAIARWILRPKRKPKAA